MFHDTNLHKTNLVGLAFELNGPACKLALLVEFYRARGERTLPVQYLKRLGFTRRQWELATKGSRPYDGRKLIDPAPAKDGCEYLGLISEHTMLDEKTGVPKSYWVIGEVDQEALDAIREQREAAAFDVIEDPAPLTVDPDEKLEPSVRDGSSLSDEEAYDLGYAHGEAAGYSKGVRDLEAVQSTGCVYDAHINKDIRDALNTHPAVATDAATFERFVAFVEEIQEREERKAFDAAFDAC